MLCVPGDESEMIFYSLAFLVVCYKVFFIWDIQFWAGLCLVRRYFFTLEIHWMCQMMCNPNLHIQYFWLEFPGRNVTHCAASAYGMCLCECREVLAVPSSDGRSLSRLPVPSLLCTLTELCWGVWKIQKTWWPPFYVSRCQIMQVKWRDCTFSPEKLPSEAAAKKLWCAKLFGISFWWTLNSETVSWCRQCPERQRCRRIQVGFFSFKLSSFCILATTV